MRGPSAFGHIDDPSDPAWVGHAEAEVPRARARRFHVALVVALVFGTLIGALALRGGSAGSPSEERVQVAADETEAIPAAILPPPADPSLIEEQPAPPGAAAAAAPAPAAPATLGSGWAPAAATQGPSTSGRVTGDLAGIAPSLVAQLDRLAVAIDEDIEVVSGWRRHAEQADLYRRFLAGTGNLAAVPGTSMHESGLAADVYVDGVALANVEGATAAAASLGMNFPVPGEPWHLEPITTPRR